MQDGAAPYTAISSKYVLTLHFARQVDRKGFQHNLASQLATLQKFFLYGCGLRTPNVRGEGDKLNTDTCGQGGRGVKNWQNLADIFYV